MFHEGWKHPFEHPVPGPWWITFHQFEPSLGGSLIEDEQVGSSVVNLCFQGGSEVFVGVVHMNKVRTNVRALKQSMQYSETEGDSNRRALDP